MPETVLKRLEREIKSLIADEKTYLKDHKKDPKSTCAAWHRGAIAAYGFVLERLPRKD